MNIFLTIALFAFGLGLIIYFAEKLVEGTVGLSLKFGISTFIISVIFIGFDPENLIVGAAGSYESVSGIALGSIIGSAMVASALAFGITAIISPMKFEKAPKQIIIIPNISILLFGLLSLDGELSRVDGLILLVGFIISVYYLIQLNKKGIDIKAHSEVSESLEEAKELSRWKSIVLFTISLLAIIVGSELLVNSSKTIISTLKISDTLFGMTILAFLVSIEEIARELPAAMKGKSEISYGNVAGSILAFFLFNAGIIALIKPIEISSVIVNFYLPLSFITTVIISVFLLRKEVSRLAGALLVALYIIFILYGYL
ncbi:MAG: calcium:sodium antiporter [Ignavibacteria bacterium GWA2_35_9]|nr:MAG: calcium:sodium antiporter [Ignavibacteria bacterium GWA2_35_9]OGU46796.1 MAG: calcium:sodium antiporter [Ignavibacteria bacterium GWB2_36_8]OGU48061.1 MAG: calcium:sodium antiporter [Ignavibacteria bacterium GWC2_36_12]OGU97812.1 MAG: calcium:sodium antiporter [Ignavibacteria bacterium RIFOXYA2_FULL_37_17]